MWKKRLESFIEVQKEGMKEEMRIVTRSV